MNPHTPDMRPPVAWQKFGEHYHLTGQYGDRPIFLMFNRGRGAERPGLRLNTNGLLVPFTPEHPHAIQIVRAINEHGALREALEALLERYVDLAGSDDCGHWNPETDEEVINARAALNLPTP